MTHRIEEVKHRLVSAGGRMSQDLGLGRITGQIVVLIYLSPDEKSLDDIGEELGLSKASVSIAVRQLDRLGMIIRVWKSGDRKSYYRTADNFNHALQKGFVEYVRQKLSLARDEIDYAMESLNDMKDTKDSDTKFLIKRVKRAAELNTKAEKLINNPIVNYIAK